LRKGNHESALSVNARGEVEKVIVFIQVVFAAIVPRRLQERAMLLRRQRVVTLRPSFNARP
jgi:hypothetical protein